MAVRMDHPSYALAAVADRAPVLERARGRIVFWIFVFYWLLIFEGALRKWALPGAEQVIFFIRVPVVMWIYVLAIRFGMWPQTVWPLAVAYAFAAASILLVPLQIATGDFDRRYLLIAGYGWQNYFVYIPVAFIIAERFRAEDLTRLIRHTAWIGIPMAVLMVLQFFSPATSVLNQGSGLDEANLFQSMASALGRIRPTGTFTSAAGIWQFGASAFALILAAWLASSRSTLLSRMGLLAATLAIATIITVGQSRGLWIACALVMVAAGLAGLLTQRLETTLRGLLLPAVCVAMAAILAPILFPSAVEAIIARWQTAYQVESAAYELGTLGRALSGFYNFATLMDQVPLCGYLLGLGGNAARQLAWVQMPDLWAEDGWSRHMVDLGPIVGTAFIAYRIAFTAWVARLVIASTRRSGDPFPVIVFGYVGILLLYGQLTNHGTLIGYAWLFVGVCLADPRPARAGTPATG
jgi:hypothetical protein